MKVVFTGSIFFNQRVGGISRYFTELNNHLKIDTKIVAPINKNLYLKKTNKKKYNIFNFNRLPQYNYLLFFNDFLSKLYIKKFDPDIIHETYYSDKLFRKNKKKVITVFDLIHEKFKKDFSIKKINEKKLILTKADHFVCISNQTKIDLINYYKIAPHKISVTYLGADHFKNIDAKTMGYENEKKYILYVGSREKYKNFNILLDALKIVKLKDICLICFGGEKISSSLINEFRNICEIKQVFGDDNTLVSLFKNALCMVNTSIYEGFSLPNVESMYLGCPLLCNDIPIFKEICGDSVLYFKNNSQDLSKKLNEIIINDGLRQNLIKSGKLQSLKYKWELCASETQKIYESILKN